MRRLGASKFRNKPRALIRVRLSASNPISVRGLSYYRRGISRCYFHSQRNTALLSRRASRLRTRLQWPSLFTWEESVEIRPRCRYRGSDGIPTWSMGYCLFLVSFSQRHFLSWYKQLAESPSIAYLDPLLTAMLLNRNLFVLYRWCRLGSFVSALESNNYSLARREANPSYPWCNDNYLLYILGGEDLQRPRLQVTSWSDL